MNQLTSRNRKFVYVGGILVLLVPIVVLGMPAREQSQPGQPGQSGGTIARLRHEYQLGETTLGDVDPASATMNLVLLGMRGIAGSVLWMQADEQKTHKNWSELEQTVESIIKLQPRFLQVWQFQGWNLAFNVSAECDAVEDRYFWVKKGAKFLLRGTDQNQDAAELYHDTGTFFGKKIGRADERKQFRRFFKSDPDPRWDGRPDEDINPDGQDNYLVAKSYYRIANEKEQLPGVEQHLMERILFRSGSARAQMDYATALEGDGQFDEIALEAWKLGNYEWTSEYGREVFRTLEGGELMLSASLKELEQLADDDPNHDLADKKYWHDRYLKMTNYPFWKMRSEVEAQQTMVEARRKLYEGKRAFFRQELVDARELLEEGLKQFEEMFDKYPELLREDEMVEDVLKSQLMWQYAMRLLTDDPISQDFPLSEVWNQNPQELERLQEMFLRRVSADL